MSTSEAQEHDESFRLIMARFDAVDRVNKEISECVKAHIADEAKIHAQVEKHSTYWALLLWLGTPMVLGVVAWFQGLFAK